MEYKLAAKFGGDQREVSYWHQSFCGFICPKPFRDLLFNWQLSLTFVPVDWLQHMSQSFKKRCCGAATVEVALLLPLILFVFLVGSDWCRVYYAAHTVQDCARNGALGASGIAFQEHNLTDVERESRGKSEALKDAKNLHPALQADEITVTTTHSEVAVTVTYSFQTVTKWPGIAGPKKVQRTVHMPILPSN